MLLWAQLYKKNLALLLPSLANTQIPTETQYYPRMKTNTFSLRLFVLFIWPKFIFLINILVIFSDQQAHSVLYRNSLFRTLISLFSGFLIHWNGTVTMFTQSGIQYELVTSGPHCRRINYPMTNKTFYKTVSSIKLSLKVEL